MPAHHQRVYITRGENLREFSRRTRMNQVQRHSRPSSDFSIARILAEDHTRKSDVSSLSNKVKVYTDGVESPSERASAFTTICNTNSSSGSRIGGGSSRLPGLGSTGCDDRLDAVETPSVSRLHSSIIIASQTESSQLDRDTRDLRALRIDRSELSWLQCTRYRPPKLLRKSAAGKSAKRRPGAHPRIPFTSSQLHVLEEKYRNTAYLSRRDVIQLSTLLRLPQSRVSVYPYTLIPDCNRNCKLRAVQLDNLDDIRKRSIF